MWRYRALVTLFAAAAAVSALRAGGWRTLRDRFSLGAPSAAPATRHVWVHAASNGELASIRPVIAALHARHPALHWLITCNTETGVALARNWDLPRSTVRLAPLDLGWVSRRAMRNWTVAAHITTEAEIWPHRVLGCRGPVILLGARISARTARGWARLGPVSRQVMQAVTLAIPQDTGSAGALAKLGLRPASLGPVVDLKAFYDPGGQRPDPALLHIFTRAHTWLAASTHPGDEDAVIQAHLAARDTEAGLRLILAPRHPRRGAAIAQSIAAQGLTVARRSLGQDPAGADVYLVDTMGEMALWYALAGRVFIGGTWTDRGGHTPYEPAHFGAALLHGPDTANFRAAFDRLAKAKAAVCVTDAKALARGLQGLADPGAQDDAGRRAGAALRQDVDLSAVIDRLDAALTGTDAPQDPT